METQEPGTIPQPEGPEKKEKKEEKKGKKLIQLERTRTAFERLQLAWIRTCLTLLAIGVGGYEYYYNRVEAGKAPLLKHISGRELSLFLIGLSFIMMLMATLQHRKSMSTLKQYFPDSRYSVATILSYLVMALSLSLILMVLLV